MEEKTFTGEVLKLVEDTIENCEKTFTEKEEHSVPPELATMILLQALRKDMASLQELCTAHFAQSLQEIQALREQFSSFAKDNLYPLQGTQEGTAPVPLYTGNTLDLTWMTKHE